MQITFVHSIASTEGWAYKAGETADIADDLALKFIASGIAEKAPALETSVIPAPENTARRTSKTK